MKSPSEERIDTKEGRLYPIPELDRRELPSVTNVLSQLNKIAFMFWSAKLTAEYAKTELIDKLVKGELTIEQIREMDVDVFVKEAKEAHKRKSDEAKSIGSRVHEFAHTMFRYMFENPKQTIDLEVDEDIIIPCSALVKWIEENEVYPVATEEIIWSEAFGGYAGTFDVVAMVNNSLRMIEVKTSKDLYIEYKLQAAAYDYAYQERNPGTITDGIGVLILDKEEGFPTFHPFSKEELWNYVEAFGHLCSLWHSLKKIKENEKLAKKIEKENRTEEKKKLPEMLKELPEEDPY